MELARLEQQVPPCRAGAVRASEIGGKDQQARRVEEPQEGPDDELGVLEADEGNDGLGEAGQQHRADEGPRDGAGEGEVVVGGGQPVVDVRGGRAVDEHIVGGLDVERLLDLGVGGDDEVEQHEGRDGEREEGVCPLLVTVRMVNLEFPFCFIIIIIFPPFSLVSFLSSCLAVDSPTRTVAEDVLDAPDCAFLEGAMTVSQYHRVN